MLLTRYTETRHRVDWKGAEQPSHDFHSRNLGEVKGQHYNNMEINIHLQAGFFSSISE